MAEYQVQKGDTLSKIAKQYGTTVADLQAANNIVNANKIRTGAKLNIPGSTSDGVTLGDADIVIEDEDYAAGGGATSAGTSASTAAGTGTKVKSSSSSTTTGTAGSDPSGVLALMNSIQYPTYTAPDLSSAYTNAGNQYTAALEAAYQAQKAELEKQAADLGDQYDALRSQAYVNARLNAIGNNEQLAAQGLAGSIYNNPMSGVSESSRIAQDVGLRSNVSTISTQEQQERDAIAAEIIQAGYTKDIQTAQYLADLSIQQAEAQANAATQSYSAAVDAYNAQMSTLSTALDDYYNAQSLQMQQESHELEVQQAQVQLEQAKLALKQAQAKAAGTTTSSSGSSKKSSSKKSSGGKSNDGTELARTLIYSVDPSTPTYKLGNTINNLRGQISNYSGQYTDEALQQANKLLYDSAVSEGYAKYTGGKTKATMLTK